MRLLIQDLDAIPSPDYDFETHYLVNNGTVKKMDATLLENHMGGVYGTIFNRGCLFLGLF
jgi:hypothetical protein